MVACLFYFLVVIIENILPILEYNFNCELDYL